jgi:hypothetical protein
MRQSHFPWEAVLALVIGLALGLLYAWVLSPVQVVDSNPSALRADFKDQYRAVIAASYAANSDLPRASARLALLGDPDAYTALSSQAQHMLANGEPFQTIQQIAQLASALQGSQPTAILTLTPPAPRQTPGPASATSLPSTAIDTSTPEDTETPLPFYTTTPRPTRTPIPPPGAPFYLAAQDTLCDESLPEGLLQVITLTVARRQLPGIELILSWAGGEEHFFTGFKPELGNGYADYQMAPGVTYTLRAAEGGTPLAGLTPPSCQGANGETYFGGLRITLQRP